MENSSRTKTETMDLTPGVSMKALRSVRFAALLALFSICLSCGDTFRPVAIPVTPNPPDPASLHYALVISTNESMVPDPNNPNAFISVFNPGAISRVDVSGDTNVAVAKIGLGPVHGTLTSDGNRVYVANFQEDSVSEYSPADSTTVNTVSLPAGSHPNFVYTTEAATVYVANLGDGVSVTPNVAAIATGTNVATQTIPVGANPIAMTETADGKKLYVVNQGSGTITAVNTSDKSVSATIATGPSPVWAVARSDSQRVYVLDSTGLLSVVDTFADSVVGTPVNVGTGASFMFYSQAGNRLYVANSTARQLAVYDVSVDPPAPLPAVDLSAGSNPACSGACTVAAVTALADGTRAYVLSYENAPCAAGETAPCTATKVTVIKTADDTVKTTVAVDPGSNGEVPNAAVCDTARFRRFIAASVDSSRVYVSNCDAGSTAVIRTSDDTHVLDLTAPFGSSAPNSTNGAVPPPQNPVFIIAGR
jgi:YVTN family beta-propeller protein